MTTTKKIPALLGADTGYRMILVADSTAATTNPIAHPARPKSGTGHFCTETARVQRQSDAEWLAEYDAADSLVQPPVSGIVAPGASHAKENAAATLAEKRVFSRPEILGTAGNGRGSSWLMGLGVSIPQGRQHGVFHVTKPSPTIRASHSISGLKSQNGANQMANSQSTTTPSTQGTPHHDHQQAALVLRATTHLSEALYQLRNNTGTTPTRKAMGLAYAAARSLSQVVGGVHHV